MGIFFPHDTIRELHRKTLIGIVVVAIGFVHLTQKSLDGIMASGHDWNHHKIKKCLIQ